MIVQVVTCVVKFRSLCILSDTILLLNIIQACIKCAGIELPNLAPPTYSNKSFIVIIAPLIIVQLWSP